MTEMSQSELRGLGSSLKKQKPVGKGSSSKKEKKEPRSPSSGGSKMDPIEFEQMLGDSMVIKQLFETMNDLDTKMVKQSKIERLEYDISNMNLMIEGNKNEMIDRTE